MKEFFESIKRWIDLSNLDKVKDLEIFRQFKFSEKELEYWVFRFTDNYSSFWNFILDSQKLSPEFIERHLETLKHYSYTLFRYQKVPEHIIERLNSDFSDWETILKYQDLSEEFLIKHLDKVEETVESKYSNRLIIERNEKIDEKVIESILNLIRIKNS